MLRILLALSGALTLLISLLGRQGAVQPFVAASVVHLQQPGPAVVTALSAAPADASLLALDNFSQAAIDNWPAASKGGQYILFGPAEDFNVSPGQGVVRTPAGEDRGAILSGVRARDVDVVVRVQTDQPPEGGNQFVYVPVRRADNATNYLARVRLGVDGATGLQFARNINGAAQLLAEEIRLPLPARAAQTGIWVRASASGSAPTTLALKAWPNGEVEPDRWQYVATDTEPRLAGPGGVGLQTYVSARASAPVVFGFSDLRISPAAPIAQAATEMPSQVPQPTPTQVAAPTPVPITATEAWRRLEPQLERAWGHDTARTLALLDSFVSQFPDDQVAREKLYAALLATGRDLQAAGNTPQAVAALERARALIPGRGEAGLALAQLTPTPGPTAEPQVNVVPPAPPRQAVPARPAPVTTTNIRTAPAPTPTRVPVVPAAPIRNAPPPTPTKVPFVVPAPNR